MKSRSRSARYLGTALILFATSAEVFGQQSVNDLMAVRRRARGQEVQPIFDGWEPNPDGSSRMYFGYLNRNTEEEIDVPIGPNNGFSPGPADRGQPTHFVTQRQKESFFVTVPKDFGTSELVWTITSNGRTLKISAALKPVFQIGATKSTTDGHAAPKLTLGPDQTVILGQSATLTAAVVGDPNAKPTLARQARRLNLSVEWRKYRGDGTVTFNPGNPAVTNGQAVTTAMFSAPGAYMLQAIARDGALDSSALCCWTSAVTKVTVTQAPSGRD